MRVLDREFTKIGLDKLDWKVLGQLSSNCRESTTQIAHRVGASRETVNYRIDRLEKAGVIAGYLTGINLRKLGFFTSHMFMRFGELNDKRENEIIEKLKNAKYVNTVITYVGAWDVEASIVAKDIYETYNYVHELEDLVKPYDYDVLIRLESIKLGALGEKGKFQRRGGKAVSKVDETDFQLLKYLSNNARASYTEIGEELNMSWDAIKYRMGNLIRQEIITDFRPVLNYAALDLNMMAVLMKFSKHGKDVDRGMKEYIDDKSVLWTARGLGKWDAISYTINRNVQEFYLNVRRMRNLLGKEMAQYDTMFAVREPKYTYFTENLYEYLGDKS